MPEWFERAYSPPCITARRGGCVIQKISRSHRKPTQPGWFSFCINRKTTPSSRSADASRHFIGRSATPPCGDARRGIRPLEPFQQFFHPHRVPLQLLPSIIFKVTHYFISAESPLPAVSDFM